MTAGFELTSGYETRRDSFCYLSPGSALGPSWLYCSSKCNLTQVLTDKEKSESDCPRTLSIIGSSNQNSQTGWSTIWRTGLPWACM